MHIKGDPLILEGPCERIDDLKYRIIALELLAVIQFLLFIVGGLAWISTQF